jgi:RND family efflux transporter MFP subunit
MMFILHLLRPTLVAVLLMVSTASGHEGHDHGEEAKSPSIAAALPRIGAASGPFELVALLRNSELTIYLDRFETNAPIVDAGITVETPAGPIAAQINGETYRIAAAWAKPGSHDLIFTITGGDQVEILTGTLVVAADPAEPATGGWTLFSPATREELKESIGFVGIATVALIGFVAGLVAARSLGRSTGKAVVLALVFMLPLMQGSAIGHEGHDHGDGKGLTAPATEPARRLADGALFVPKPVQRILAIRTNVSKVSTHARTVELPGRIIPDPNASGVVQASVSGRLFPPEGGFPRLGTVVRAGDVLAYVTPPLQAIDVSDMRQKAGELDQQINIVEKRVARYEQLAQTGAAAKVALDEARLELNGLRERRAALDKARSEPEKLIAPVSGIVASANAVAGQIAETNAIVFQIVDPSRLWVEALTFKLLPDAQRATALTGEGRKLTLAFQGAGLTDRSQAIPVHFAIDGAEKGLRVGQLVTVLAATGDNKKGIAVPRASILRGANGQTMLFEHTAAERFEPRIVRVEPLDADRAVVLDGLTAGRRVVVQGAELLNQIR